MEELSKLYFDFWSQFCPAYMENSAFIFDPRKKEPDPVPYPYLTYSVVRPAFGERTATGVNVYDRSVNSERLRGIGAEIEKAIPEGGIIIDMPSGRGQIAIERGNPFIQSRTLPEDEVRDAKISDYVSIIINSFITF